MFVGMKNNIHTFQAIGIFYHHKNIILIRKLFFQADLVMCFLKIFFNKKKSLILLVLKCEEQKIGNYVFCIFRLILLPNQDKMSTDFVSILLKLYRKYYFVYPECTDLKSSTRFSKTVNEKYTVILFFLNSGLNRI